MQNSLVYLFVVCVLAVGASSLGRPEEPCVAPLQWEGRTVQYDHSTGRNTRAAVAYDALNQRIRVLEQKTGHTPCKKYVAEFRLFYIPLVLLKCIVYVLYRLDIFINYNKNA